MRYPVFYGTNATQITGELQTGDSVTLRDVFPRRDRVIFGVLVSLCVTSHIAIITWLLVPTHHAAESITTTIVGISAVILMICIQALHAIHGITLSIFGAFAKDPVPLQTARSHRVAILTTLCPPKEPFEMALPTLRAMLGIQRPDNCSVDAWLLDESGSPEIEAACSALGVNYFTRKGVEEWNQPSGPHKAKTKHGNHNAWRAAHEHNYDIVAQMDPDHVPHPLFLERTLGYFNDPDVAYVVAPQVYGNQENRIAQGAAFLAYVFHGIIQRGANGLGAPLLIGTNHLFRTSAWRQINGYQDSIIEDHFTALHLFGNLNQRTGNRWRGIYTPDILSVGEGPESFTAWFGQQKRWAYGIWEILRNHSPKLFPLLTRRQRISFALLQQFYPGVAISLVLSNVLSAVYLFAGDYMGFRPPIEQWAAFYVPAILTNLVLFLWLRKFNLVKHEQKDWGLNGMSLMIITLPLYVSAAFSNLIGRKLVYNVTPKAGGTGGTDNIRTFQASLFWVAWPVTALTLAAIGVGNAFGLVVWWLCVTLAIGAAPLLMHYGTSLHTRAKATVTAATTRARSRSLTRS